MVIRTCAGFPMTRHRDVMPFLVTFKLLRMCPRNMEWIASSLRKRDRNDRWRCHSSNSLSLPAHGAEWRHWLMCSCSNMCSILEQLTPCGPLCVSLSGKRAVLSVTMDQRRVLPDTARQNTQNCCGYKRFTTVVIHKKITEQKTSCDVLLAGTRHDVISTVLLWCDICADVTPHVLTLHCSTSQSSAIK